MKVLVTAHGLALGGIERSLIGLLGPLVDAGNEVDLLLFRPGGELMPLLDPRVRLLVPDPVLRHLETPIPTAFKEGSISLGFLRILAKGRATARRAFGRPASQDDYLARWVNRLVADIPGKYDVVLGFQVPHDFILSHVEADVKVGWGHTDYSVVRRDVRFEEEAWRQLDRVVAVSDSARDAFLQVFPGLRAKMLVVENTLDVEAMRSLAREELPRVDLDRGRRKLTLCTVGRYTYPKAFERAIEACTLLVAQGVDVTWYAVGYGPEERALRALVEKAGLQDVFILTGPRPNPYPYMAACDIYVQPSRYEGKAVAVREAQALGKPVLITDFPTAPSQLTDGWDGLVCGSTPEQLADAISSLAQDAAQRERLAANCLAGDYSNRAAVDGLLAELRALVTNK